MNLPTLNQVRLVESIKRSLPSGLLNQLRPIWRKKRDLQLRLKMLNGERLSPGFLIIGAMKGGTTSLFHYLLMHPEVESPFTKEIHYFDFNWIRPQAWYSAHFPRTSHIKHAITGEASPGYLFNKKTPERVLAQYPEMKIIVILRNPVSRAISHYFHEKKHGWEDRPMEAALLAPESYTYHELDDELAYAWYSAYMNSSLFSQRSSAELVQKYPLHHSYIRYGMYAEDLENWLEFFPSEQLLVLSSEELFDQPQDVMKSCEDFLGLQNNATGDFGIFNKGKNKMNIPDDLLDQLATIYKAPNERLTSLIGRDFGW